MKKQITSHCLLNESIPSPSVTTYIKLSRLVLSSLRWSMSTSVICLLVTALSVSVYAQTPKAKTSYPLQVSFAESTEYQKIPLADILKTPTLTSLIPGCQVSGFTVSFLPKGGEFLGPFRTNGATLSENNVSYLKEFTNMTVRIFFEDIHASCDGRDSVLSHIIVTSNP